MSDLVYLSDYSNAICLENFGFKYASDKHRVFLQENDVQFLYNNRSDMEALELERRLKFVAGYVFTHFMGGTNSFPTLHFEKLPYVGVQLSTLCKYFDLPLPCQIYVPNTISVDEFRWELQKAGGVVDRVFVYIVNNNPLIAEFKYEARNVKGLWITC